MPRSRFMEPLIRTRDTEARYVSNREGKDPFLVLKGEGETYRVSGRGTISQLLDLLEVDKRRWNSLSGRNSVRAKERLNEALGDNDRLIRLECHLDREEQWWVHAFGSEHFTSIPFQKILDLVENRFPGRPVHEKTVAEGKAWTVPFDAATVEGRRLRLNVRVTSGSNDKTRSVKVIPFGAVGQVSIRTVPYLGVKHTKNWRTRLTEHLDQARQDLDRIEVGVTKALTTRDIDPGEVKEKGKKHVRATLKVGEEKREAVAKAYAHRIDQYIHTGSGLFAALEAASDVANSNTDGLTDHGREQMETVGLKVVEETE